jgi:hypothetical protein
MTTLPSFCTVRKELAPAFVLLAHSGFFAAE